METTEKTQTPMIDKIMDEAQKPNEPHLSDEDKRGKVYRHLANLYTTYLSAGGHGKAERNEWQYKKLRAEMESKGWEIPSSKILIAYGVFNGEGSN